MIELPSTKQRGGNNLSVVDSKNEPVGLTLKNIFDKTNMKIVDILSNVDVSRSFVERLFRGKESQFDMVLSIIRFLECDEMTLIDRYCEEINMAKNLLYAMEYCDRRNNLPLLERLIERSEGKTLPELREMRTLYGLSLQRKRDGRIENLERVLLKVKSSEPSTSISQVFQKFVEIQIYNELKEYGIVRSILRELKIERTDNTFFLESFQWRLNQVQQSIALRFHADFEKSRELAFELLRMSESKYFHAFAYGNLGLSYAFTNKKEEALRYLNKSQQLYSETGMKNDVWNETIEFFRISWGQPIELEDISSSKNLALRLIKLGNCYQSIKILDKIEEVEGQSPMSLYLRGLATQDENCHWRSLEIYIRDRGDKLFAILPRNELIRLNQNQCGVNALYNILSTK
jgi:tetratricopeptide (TPR) repeat protein